MTFKNLRSPNSEIMEISEDFVKLFRQNKFNKMQWSKEETPIKDSRKYREEMYSKYILRFSNALLLALRKSVFGCYLNSLNPQQNQDTDLNENKLAITEYIIRNLKEKEVKRFQEKNYLFEDTMKVLRKIIKYNGSVDLEYLMRNMRTLRITDFYVTHMDESVKSFLDLQFLILAGNNLRDLPGEFLPKNLIFLELYDNFMENFEHFVKKAPKTILHLGFSRNNLDDNSSYHLLAGSNNFLKLSSLDLSENDIYNLRSVLAELRGMMGLRALQLEGNPCYVVPNYKSTVLKYFPKLVYLDNIEIMQEDRQVENDKQVEAAEPQIVFLCYRIMGLQHPPKDAKNNQTIHIEFNLPLLETVHTEKVAAEKSFNIPDKSEKESQTPKKEKLQKVKESGSGTNKSSKKSKISKQKSPYERSNEYDPDFEENSFSFKTARMPWNAVIEFPPVFIESPEHDLRAIRDTFRSRVEVRVVYLKTTHASKSKPKKEKQSAKSKPASNIQKNVQVEDSEETILKKITLYRFNCDLKNIGWSDETIDYHWADHPQIGMDAIRMDGCLKVAKFKCYSMFVI
ncbi:uncharacterized protein isoform X2 [Leptinotarsa decemlineata]|uniref:uncharacterized protein isoform X2 n=1 Tax=Leptinotarsa decemlineata TaxID=7539 RepID=UPI003D30C7EF